METRLEYKLSRFLISQTRYLVHFYFRLCRHTFRLCLDSHSGGLFHANAILLRFEPPPECPGFPPQGKNVIAGRKRNATTILSFVGRICAILLSPQVWSLFTALVPHYHVMTCANGRVQYKFHGGALRSRVLPLLSLY